MDISYFNEFPQQLSFLRSWKTWIYDRTLKAWFLDLENVMEMYNILKSHENFYNDYHFYSSDAKM